MNLSCGEIAYEDDLVKLYLADAGDFLPTLEAESVDLVLTDPPYPEEFQSCYDMLGEQAARLLTDRGSLVSLCGHYQVPYVVNAIGKHLRFWWACGMHQTARTRMPGKWVNIWWKPAFWWVKNGRRLDLTSMLPNDMLTGEKPDKAWHKWEQPVNWFSHWIEMLTLPGETVLDPFSGAATTLVAARALGRKAIGVEVDPVACARSVERLQATAPARGEVA